MKRLVFVLSLSALALAAIPMESEACSCMQPDIARSYSYADDVAKIRIVGQLGFAPTGLKWYWGIVRDAFKGCLDRGAWVLVETRSSGAACGMSIQNRTYLLNGSDRGSFWGIPRVAVNNCDYNPRWNALSDEALDYLYSRYNCCHGNCACTDGTEPFNCFVNPCTVSECGNPDATCSANYCGGCRAEWYDSTGALADCASGCQNDADCSEDTWCRDNKDGMGECVAYAGPGEHCEGFVVPWMRERCEPDLRCFHPEPTGDIPGICGSCFYDGKPYQAGETFPASDGCNKCRCTEDGFVACTEMACFPTCDPAREMSCEDSELVCMADSIDDTGMCGPFDHGTTVGAGYKCGGSIGVGCAKGLFCDGMPDDRVGGSGICTLMD